MLDRRFPGLGRDLPSHPHDVADPRGVRSVANYRKEHVCGAVARGATITDVPRRLVVATRSGV